MMMAQPPQQALEPEKVQQILTNLKRQMSQVEGERTTMLEDAKTAVFNNVMQILNQLYGELAQANQKAQQAQSTLEEIYKGWPDVKIAMDKKAEKEAPAKSKIVKGT